MLDAEARAHLGVALRVAAARRPRPRRSLTAGERARVAGLASEARRRDWLLGRAALEAVGGAAGDTSALAFPHPRLSLAHAGGVAVAVAAGAGLAGVGIDVEPAGRRVAPAAARFFLAPAEAAAAAGDAAALLRLWTVKEALFKATPDNAAAVLAGYRLADAGDRLGTALGARGEEFRYASVAAAGGVVSVAVCLPPEAGEGRRGAVG